MKRTEEVNCSGWRRRARERFRRLIDRRRVRRRKGQTDTGSLINVYTSADFFGAHARF
jgi:hypothetical protein